VEFPRVLALAYAFQIWMFTRSADSLCLCCCSVA